MSSLQAELIMARLQQNVDQLSADNPFAIYSAVNRHALHSIAHLSNAIADAEIVYFTWSYSEAKERVGQERGALNGIFVRGSFSTADVVRVNYYIQQQNDQAAVLVKIQPRRYLKITCTRHHENIAKFSFRQAFMDASQRGNTISANAGEVREYNKESLRLKRAAEKAEMILHFVEIICKRHGDVCGLYW